MAPPHQLYSSSSDQLNIKIFRLPAAPCPAGPAGPAALLGAAWWLGTLITSVRPSSAQCRQRQGRGWSQRKIINEYNLLHAFEIDALNTVTKVKDIRADGIMRAMYSGINRVQGTPLAAPSRVQNSDA